MAERDPGTLSQAGNLGWHSEPRFGCGFSESGDRSRRAKGYLPLVVVVNYASNQSQCYLRIPAEDIRQSVRLEDLAVYERNGEELLCRGLDLDLPALGISRIKGFEGYLRRLKTVLFQRRYQDQKEVTKRHYEIAQENSRSVR